MFRVKPIDQYENSSPSLVQHNTRMYQVLEELFLMSRLLYNKDIRARVRAQTLY